MVEPIDDALLARTRPLDALIRAACARFPILAFVTPADAAEEQERLLAAWTAGDAQSPRWTPPSVDRALLARTRDAVALAITTIERDPLHDGPRGWLGIYRARLVELALDLAVVDAAFGPQIGDAAAARFEPSSSPSWKDDRAREDADGLERAWIDDPRAPEPSDQVRTDDEGDPRSLVTRMRASISTLGLPVGVVVRERVGALAAAGDGLVVVAAGRKIPPREVERVVLHEIEGHVLPRERGRRHAPSINASGSAGASEDEEGRALFLEERAGFLHAARRRSLAARHRAARLVAADATFVDVVRDLRSVDVPLPDALAIASRVMRGGHRRGADVISGVARERVYLPAFVRVRRAIEDDPAWLDRLGSRRLALAAWAMLK